MEQKYLIDTNSLIDAQIGKLPKNWLMFIVSFITYIEFFGYKNVTQANKDFIALATVIEIDSAIINNCIELRKTHHIKLPDAIIAATAIFEKLTIITNNEKDFENIQDVKFVNPYKL